MAFVGSRLSFRSINSRLSKLFRTFEQMAFPAGLFFGRCPRIGEAVDGGRRARETGLIAGVYFLKTRARNDRLLVPHLDVLHVDQGAQITRVDRAELKAVRPDVP
jgi:hypothetical protein